MKKWFGAIFGKITGRIERKSAIGCYILHFVFFRRIVRRSVNFAICNFSPHLQPKKNMSR